MIPAPVLYSPQRLALAGPQRFWGFLNIIFPPHAGNRRVPIR
jgi:hypothetical protein